MCCCPPATDSAYVSHKGAFAPITAQTDPLVISAPCLMECKDCSVMKGNKWRDIFVIKKAINERIKQSWLSSDFSASSSYLRTKIMQVG